MATSKARLEKIEARMAPEIAPDVRDPELVDLVRMFDKERPLEQIPCGVSGRRLAAELIKIASGTTLPTIAEVSV